MPEHPHYSICFFLFFIIGLSLGSMLVTIMQMQVENKYMKALQLIDEQHAFGNLSIKNEGHSFCNGIESPQKLSPDNGNKDVAADGRK
jgi:hypothetical protein